MNAKKAIGNGIVVVAIALILQGAVGVRAQERSGLVAPGADLQKVRSGFVFTEGPTADAEGNVYFTDVRAARIYRWSCKDGSISVHREDTGNANGLMFDGKGRLVVCEMGAGRVVLDDMNGKITVLADSYQGRKLNSPNDLWIDLKGGVYFSDPRFGRGVEGVQEGSMQVYYISPDHEALTRVTDDLARPNGLIGTPDGKLLYVADPGEQKTWVYTVRSDGTLADKKLFCGQGSDGMALDERGNVYVTGASTITAYSPEGRQMEEIRFPERPANMTFAGEDRKTLFVTARTSVYTVKMAVRGAPTPLEQAKLEAGKPERTEHWPNWRGPTLNGAAEATGLPAEWSQADGVLWSTDLPGPGSATPAIWGNRVFLTAADSETGELLAMCLDAATGGVLWQRGHGQNRRRGNNDMTSPSPVTDGQRVVFMFGTGRLVAYDYQGGELWQRDLVEEFGTLSWNFGYGGSPLLHGGRLLYVQMMRRPTHRSAPPDKPLESFLLAIDPANGKGLWRQVRPSKAVDESWESYVTPVPHGGAPEAPIVLGWGADALTGHDPATGREVWRWEFNERRRRNWRQVSTPASDGRRIYAAVGRGQTMVAVVPDGRAESPEDRVLWSLTRYAPDVCSPLLYEGRLYVLDGDRRVLTCLDPETGSQMWQGEVGGDTVIRSSPTAADGKIYFVDESGRVFVVAAAEEFQVLSRIEMGGGQPARSSIAIAGDRLYVRTAAALHCIGGTPPLPMHEATQ